MFTCLVQQSLLCCLLFRLPIVPWGLFLLQFSFAHALTVASFVPGSLILHSFPLLLNLFLLISTLHLLCAYFVLSFSVFCSASASQFSSVSAHPGRRTDEIILLEIMILKVPFIEARLGRVDKLYMRVPNLLAILYIYIQMLVIYGWAYKVGRLQPWACDELFLYVICCSKWFSIHSGNQFQTSRVRRCTSQQTFQK